MLDTLEKYYSDGLLTKQVHPTLPLTIWNYTDTVQYNSLWDDVLVMTRGLVTDNDGNIVARPFKKFFNDSEHKHTPTKDFTVQEKMDGSLGILFNYKGEWILSTRGSFTSEQSVKGFEMLQKYEYQNLHIGYTYLFEIIYEKNRIVVRYPFEDLILLGMIETKTGYEVDLHSDNVDIRLKNMLKNIGFNLVKQLDGIKDYTNIKQKIGDNEEGFVVRFSNGDRMKIKGDEYVRLHKIVTSLSTTMIWEILSSGEKIESIINNIPDEFYQKIKEVVRDLVVRHENIQKDYFSYFQDIKRKVGVGDRKLFAEEAKRYNHPSLLFNLLDGKDISKTVWKIVKPEYEKI